MPIYETKILVQIQAEDSQQALIIGRKLHRHVMTLDAVETVIKFAPRETTYPDRFWSSLRQTA